MPYTSLDKILSIGTAAERAAFTPDPPAGVVSVWHESDTGNHYAWSGSAWVQVNGSGGGGGGAYEVANWAALLALTGVPDGREYGVLAPVVSGGRRGTRWVRDSSSPTGWRCARGQRLVDQLVQVDGVSGGSTAEQYLFEPLFEAGVLGSCRSIRARAKFIWSAADAATRTLRLRLETADRLTSVWFSQVAAISASARIQTIAETIYPASDTLIQSESTKVNINSAPTPDSSTAQNSPQVTAYTTPALSTTALHLCATVQQGAGPTSTASLTVASIYAE